jgi:glucosyl-3-phosphoglycerate synthase
VDAFAHGLRMAAESFLAGPLGAPPIPNWNRVTAAIPEIYTELEEAVESDNCVAEEHLVSSFLPRKLNSS